MESEPSKQLWEACLRSAKSHDSISRPCSRLKATHSPSFASSPSLRDGASETEVLAVMRPSLSQALGNYIEM